MIHHLERRSLVWRRLRCTIFGLVCGVMAGPVTAAAPINVLTEPAAKSAQALNAVLLSVTRAGDRLVAVGERGVVLYSDDQGASWVQGEVPVSSTLTAVQFVDARQGWAVGHAGVVLHSKDGGEHWTLQLDGRRAAQIEFDAAQAQSEPGSPRRDAAQLLVDDGPDKPLLALDFADANHGIVAGAFGMALQTRDGGKTWQSIMGRLPNDWGAHIYAIGRQGDNLYMTGEQGLLLRSLDGGQQFEKIETPYEGSFFTLGLMPGGDVVLAGLRGTVLLSSDQGSTFQSLKNPIPVSLTAALEDDNGILLVNQAGGLLRISPSGALRPVANTQAPLTGVAANTQGRLVGVGFSGPKLLAPVDPSKSHAVAE